MNLTRCKNGHYYDKDKYKTCPHCRDTIPIPSPRPLSESLLRGCASLLRWVLYTVVISGIPMLLYLSLSLFFEPPLDSGLTELAALFFGITAPVVLDQEERLDYKNTLLNQGTKFFCNLLFVFLCLYYGYIYIRLFHGGALTGEEIRAYYTVVWFLGIMCCILVAGSRFLEGFAGDAE